MNQRSNDEEAGRRFLLGQLQESEQIAIEDRLLMDDAYFERLEMIEDELIDDYVSGTMPQPEREAFSAHFLATPERNKKLKVALALHKYAKSHSASRTRSEPEPAEAEGRQAELRGLNRGELELESDQKSHLVPKP